MRSRLSRLISTQRARATRENAFTSRAWTWKHRKEYQGDPKLSESRSHAQPTAEEMIPGSLKRSKSYAEELANETQETLDVIAQNRNSPLREKARNMLKLIKQAERLQTKISQRGGRT